MPVALSRFVRVMTGGKLVTDELVDVRDAKVGEALDDLQAQIQRLTAKGLRIPALEDSHRDLSDRRAQAKTKGSNREICEDLEAVKFDARDAADDAEQQVDRGLLAAGTRDVKLNEVDTALGELRNAEAAIGEPALKTPITQSIPPLVVRRDALADASTIADIERQLGRADALVLDIGAAETDALQADVDSRDVATRRDTLDRRITLAKNWLNSLKDGAAKTNLDQRRQSVETDRANLNNSADYAAFDNALTTTLTAATNLYNDAVAESAQQKKESADRWIAAFTAWERSIAKISASNPVPTETAALRLEKQTAESIANDAGRRNALDTFLGHAGALQTKVQNIQSLKADIERTGMTLTALLNPKPPPTTPPTALIDERASVLAGIPGAVNQGSTAAAVTRLGTLKNDMLAIKPKAEDWRAGELDLDKLKESVTKSLTDTRLAIDKLAEGGTKTTLNSELAGLSLLKTGADSMAPAEAKKSLFQVDKQAIALLERAHKQALTEQLATPTGKQDIDELIKNLGDKTADPRQQALCRAALAARFNLEVEVLEGLSVDRLPRLYNLFAQVPASHVGHDKLTKLAYNTDPNAEASYYSGNSKKIMLIMGESDSTYAYKAQSGDAVENLNYFSATALHEIGHGVDEKQQIMTDSRMAGAEFGGWKKETIDTVAQAHFTKSFASFVASPGPTQADLVAMVKSVLESGTCKQPTSNTAPLGSLRGKWAELTSSAGYKDLTKIRNPGVSPWNAPIAAGDRAYHEAYDGKWVSYLTAQRSKGISNYQWRAPAEWFAELYAYYHMTKKDVPSCVETYIKG